LGGAIAFILAPYLITCLFNLDLNYHYGNGISKTNALLEFFYLLEYLGFIKHDGSHTTAVSVLRASGTLENAQGVLHHSNPATTQIYTATILEEQRLKHASETLIDSQF
jgi:hypothetical protein